ncbi:MAG: MFS transporter [Pseudomonadota bacterium]
MGTNGKFLIFSTIATVALVPLLVLPAMVGVLVDYAQMSDSLAGWSASVHSFAGAVIGLFFSLKIHRTNLRQVALFGLSAAFVADVISGFTAGASVPFFAARMAAGFGLGAAYVVSLAAFARYEGFERGFGIFVTLQFIVSGLGLYVIPVYSDVLGVQGMFFLFAGLDLLALCLFRFLPGVHSQTNPDETTGGELKILVTFVALAGIVGFALFEAANNAQFTYIERFAVDIGLTEHQIGISLLIASLVGIPGAFCIVIVGQRFGIMPPLVLGIGVAVVGLSILINATSYTTYFVGSCFMGFSWAFCLPFIETLLASIDRKGSVIAAGSSLATLGGAMGPGLAALVVTGGNYKAVFILSIGLFLVTIVALFLSNRAIRISQ